jgi:hypothetical protein
VGAGRDDRLGQRRSRHLLDGRYKDVGVGIALGAPGRGGGATFTGDFGARG